MLDALEGNYIQQSSDEREMRNEAINEWMQLCSDDMVTLHMLL